MVKGHPIRIIIISIALAQYIRTSVVFAVVAVEFFRSAVCQAKWRDLNHSLVAQKQVN